MNRARRALARRRRDERGFTLVEVLVVMGILAIVTPVLVNAVVLGFRTVGGTQDRVTGSTGLGAFSSRFTRDVAGATGVDLAPPACAGVEGVLVAHLALAGSDVYYTFARATGALTRYACAGDGAPAAARLGLFGAGAFGGATQTGSPVTLVCGTAAMPCDPVQSVTISVRVDAASDPVDVTAVRRVTP